MASPSSLTRRCLISRPSIASSSRIRLPVLSRTYHSIPPVPPLRTSYHPTRPVRPLPKWLGSRSASTSTALPDASATAASAGLPPPSRPSRIRVTPPNLEAVKQEGYLDDDVQLVPADQAWLNITPDAISQLEKITAREPADVLAQGKLALRVGVESGGCHGYQYTMALTEERGVDDYVMQPEGVNCIPVVVDLISLGLLKGATLHHATELIGSSFRLQDNPQAKEGGACGCGVSWEAKT